MGNDGKEAVELIGALLLQVGAAALTIVTICFR